MIYLVLILMIALALIGCGGFMVYSAITGKGIKPPEPDALFQLRAQYYLRGLIGIGFIAIGGIIFIGILKMY